MIEKMKEIAEKNLDPSDEEVEQIMEYCRENFKEAKEKKWWSDWETRRAPDGWVDHCPEALTIWAITVKNDRLLWKFNGAGLGELCVEYLNSLPGSLVVEPKAT